MKKQIDVVYAAVVNVLDDMFVPNETVAKSILTKSDREDIIALCIEATRNGEVEVKGKKRTYDISSDKDMQEYWAGTVSNHVRRDPRLNGGTERKDLNEVKKGPRDTLLKSLRLMLDKQDDPKNKADIQAAIDARLAELKPAAEKFEIDVNILPDHLKHLA